MYTFKIVSILVSYVKRKEQKKIEKTFTREFFYQCFVKENGTTLEENEM